MSLSSLSGTIHRARSHLNLTRYEFELATPLRGARTLASVADHVIEQLRRWLPVHRQAEGILILADRLGRALAIDAIGRPRIVAKAQQRRLRVVDEVRAGRRAVIGASLRVLVGLDRAGDDADARADRP